MRKRLSFVILLALAALLAATPALAAGSSLGKGDPFQYRNRIRNQPAGPNGGQLFTLTGVITDLGSDTITVLIYNGNRLVQPYVGTELVVQVTESTRYLQWSPDGCSPISFDDLEVDHTTSMQGMVSDGAFLADRVTMDVPCCSP